MLIFRGSISEYGYAVATMDAQPVDQEASYLPSSESVASICLEYTTEGLGEDSNASPDWKQTQVASAGPNGQNPRTPIQSSDDSLFRMCGAEMIRVKTEQLQKRRSGVLHLRTATVKKEI